MVKIPGTPPAESPDQGELFTVEFRAGSEGNGPVGEITEVHPEGTFPEVNAADVPTTPHAIAASGVHEAQVARNRREGNRGKHSPMQRDGNYQNIQLGDFLPGFGPVTERRWEEAKAHARGLESARIAKLATQPTLAASGDEKDVEAVVAEVADKLDIKHGFEGEKTVVVASAVGGITINPDKRRAFGSVPGLVRDPNVNKAKIEVLTVEDYSRVEPEFLRKSYHAKNAEWSYNGIALTQDEFSKVLLNPKTFTERVAAQASRGHTLSNQVRRAEVKISGPMHAYEDLSKRHEGIVRGLSAQHARLLELAKEAQAPGFAHRKELDLVLLAQEAWQLGFKTLLQTAARTNKLSIEQAEAMEWALYDKLIHGSQRDKIGYWQDMLAVTAEYTNRRRLTMISSKHRVDSEARKLKKQLDAFSEEHGTLR